MEAEILKHSIVEKQAVCKHCSETIVKLVKNNSGESFCCHGCEFVYQILSGNGLETYYSMSQTEARAIPRADFVSQYEYLKNESYHSEYCVNESYTFFVEGIECLACTWLFDNIASLNKHFVTAYYDHSSHSLKVELDDSQFLYEALTPILQLGYKLKPIKKISDLNFFNRERRRTEIIRLAVTMLFMGNIGLLSLSHYLGLSGTLLEYFQIVSSVLFILIPTYCSWPFYKTSWSMLKVGKISLDTPISLSIIVGAILSYVHFFSGNEILYFDSIASLVFLILLVRFSLNRIYEGVARGELTNFLVGKSQACVLGDDGEIFKHTSQLRIGEIVKVEANSLSPATGKIIKGSSYFNDSLLTGESKPVFKTVGDNVFAGSYNYSHNMIIAVTEQSEDNPLSQVLEQVEKRSVVFSNFSNLTKNYSIILLIGYLIIGLGLFMSLPFEQAFERFLALTIIGCPCALGIGIPLAGILANQRLFKRGIIVKDPNFFEKIRQIDHVYLDKTGTLTTGLYKVIKTNGDNRYLSILISLESRSTHPVARSIVAHWPAAKKREVHNFRENPGVGVEGVINNKLYQIRSNEDRGCTSLYCEDINVYDVYLEEELRLSASDILEQVSSRAKVTILSGDNYQNVKNISDLLHVDNIEYLSELKPDEKVKKLIPSTSLFVGDGLNDIPAMANAHLSISFNVSDLVNKACQCVFVKPNLGHIITLFTVSEQVEGIVKKNIYFSAVYNIAGAIAASMGYISPLVAAIFMPLSSLSIILMTVYRSRRL